MNDPNSTPEAATATASTAPTTGPRAQPDELKELVGHRGYGPRRAVEIRRPFSTSSGAVADIHVVVCSPTPGHDRRLSIGLRRTELIELVHVLSGVVLDDALACLRKADAVAGGSTAAARRRHEPEAPRRPGEPPQSYVAVHGKGTP